MKTSPIVLAALLASAAAGAATFTVTNTNDSGAGSLRQAILDANANPGLDTIAFDIPGSGVHTISPLTILDTITDPVILDGYTQPGAQPNTDPNGFNGTLLIEISGASAGPANGLNVAAGGSTIRGLVINRFSGETAGAGNAIHLFQGGGNHVEGNFLGPDASGTIAAGIGDDALVLDQNSNDNVIGGPAPGQRNVISATVHTAFFIESSGNVIRGNFIGTQKDGASPLGNAGGIGFAGSFNGDNDNVIGGTGPGEGNVIAFNVFGGIGGELASGTGNSIRGNSIHDNGGLGIDWVPLGPTPNDPGDADTGMNDYQNFPIIQSVANGANTHVVAKLDSSPSTTFDLDFYANPSCSNFPREFLEGETYLGSTQVTTDGSGHAAIDVVLPVATEAGARISATATDPAGNTSEFSQRIIFSMSPGSGPSAGGTALSIAGTDFANPTTVTIGGADGAPSFVDDHTLTAMSPALPPGTVNDVVAMTPDGTTGTLVKGWVSDFLDVDAGNQFYSYVTTLVSNGITVGVGGGNYGVNAPTLRQQMAVFILKAKHGLCYTPPPCIGMFGDVPCSSNFAPWIEAMANEGITGGCGGGNFCPTNPVRRDQMAVFLLKGEHGSSYVPPACQGIFGDVACPSTFADWIEQLSAEGITGGCGGGNYCPASASTRGQMAVFLTKTFHLQ
ncbi:MAG TPA: S-layer homology domain-containing protein [Thermoanaerobaculia bacterium]|nr:S-layer homology domain-containing protein [Thermoanaerobaculia bacterium]